MVAIRQERRGDAAAREALLDVSYGPVRFTKTSSACAKDVAGARLRCAEAGRLIGTLRLWPISAGGGRPALLLGTLAVDPKRRSAASARTLVQHALRRGCAPRHGDVLLVGDAPDTGGSASRREDRRAWLTGALRTAPAARVRASSRVLLDGAQGLISACGQVEPSPTLQTLVAGWTATTGPQ